MFKVGDKVKCIRGQEFNYLIEGVIYTIEQAPIDANDNEATCRVEGINCGFYVNRFELVKAKSYKKKGKSKMKQLNNKQKYLFNKLNDIEKFLYLETFKKRLPSQYRDVFSSVRSYRRTLVSSEFDLLEDKSKRFSNNGQWARVKSRDIARIIFEAKTPTTEALGQWVSVEIECIFPSEKSISGFVSFVRKNRLTNFVTVKNDGSIDAENSENCDCGYNPDDDEECTCENQNIGKEIVITYRKDSNAETLNVLCQKLNELKVWVNKSCGLHVHFDMRHLKSISVTNIAKRVALCVPALKQMLPKSRQENQYCRNVINSMKRGDRYSFVNLHSYSKYKTLEIRGHSGSIDATKIHNWVLIIEKIMLTKNKEAVIDIPMMISKFNFGSALTGYIMSRYQKFTKTEAVKGDDVKEDQQVLVSDVRDLILDNGSIVTFVGPASDSNFISIEPSWDNLLNRVRVFTNATTSSGSYVTITEDLDETA